MYIYSFNNNLLNFDTTTLLYDLFAKTVVYNKYNVNSYLIPYVVENDKEMRVDKICYYFYGNYNFVEEIYKLNNIVNPWSVKQGDIIYYIDPNFLSLVYEKDDTSVLDKQTQQALINTSKNTQKDPNRGAPPTVKPTNLKQVDVNKDNKQIKIMNKFK